MLSSSSHLTLGWILLGRCYFIDYPSNLLFTLSVLLIPNVASKQNSDGKTCNIFNILLMILTGQSGIKPSFYKDSCLLPEGATDIIYTLS